MNKKIIYVMITFFVLIFVYAGFNLVNYISISIIQERQFSQLRGMIKPAGNQIVEDDELSNLQELYKENNDLVGWVEIENTNINYPVMYESQDAQFYLRKAFDKTYSTSGVPFIGANCTLESDNVILYGHNMKNGTMFADLLKYESINFYKDHKIIQLMTLHEMREYEVIAAFKSSINQSDDEVFRYYEAIELKDELDFNRYIDELSRVSLYKTDKQAVYGDSFLTLSTCDYDIQNGRFIVVAVRINNS